MLLPPFLLIIFLILLAISVADLKHGIIPDTFLVGLALLSLFHLRSDPILSSALLGGLAYSLHKLYPLLRGKEGLGLGDVKMMTVAGLWLSPLQIPLFLVASGGIGVGIGLLWRILKKKQRFPLGPALALALGLCIVGEYGLSKGESKMTMIFSGPRFPPAAGGKPDSIVVLIHGYGADGEDLLSLGKAWAPLLPHTLFIAPHGPAICEENPSGKQWFGLKDWAPSRILTEIQALTPSFNHYLDNLLKLHGLPPEKLALVGFSQGAMLALHIGLHRPQCAGVVAYSGALLDDPAGIKVALPPVLLVHVTEDQVIPASASQRAETQLKALHVPVTLSLLPRLEHGIDGRALGLGGAFLKEHLYESAGSDLWKQAKESKN